jgi:hypothetical protein
MSSDKKDHPTRFKRGEPTPQRRFAGDYAPGRPKVESVLTREDLAAFEAYLRQPTTTQRGAIRWVRERGYSAERLGHNAIIRYFGRFVQKLRLLRDTAEFAAILSRLAADTGAPPLPESAMLQFEMLLTQELFNLANHKKLEPEEWDRFSRVLSQAIGSRTKLDRTKILSDEAKRKAERLAPGKVRRIDGNALSDKVRRVLGMPLPGEVSSPRALPAPPPPVEPPASPAPEGRQTLAHDASRGERDEDKLSPGGA